MRDRLAFGQEFQHPNLSNDGYRVTSLRDKNYNCAAWAAGEQFANKWWEPGKGKGYYWPNGVPQEITIQAFVKVYELNGFVLCDNGDLEDGFVKIALFEDDEGVFALPAKSGSCGFGECSVFSLMEFDPAFWRAMDHAETFRCEWRKAVGASGFGYVGIDWHLRAV